MLILRAPAAANFYCNWLKMATSGALGDQIDRRFNGVLMDGRQMTLTSRAGQSCIEKLRTLVRLHI